MYVCSFRLKVRNADVKGGETFDAVFPVLKYASITGSLWDMGGNDKSLPQVKISLLKDGKPTGTVITTKAGYSFGKLYPGPKDTFTPARRMPPTGPA